MDELSLPQAIFQGIVRINNSRLTKGLNVGRLNYDFDLFPNDIGAIAFLEESGNSG